MCTLGTVAFITLTLVSPPSQEDPRAVLKARFNEIVSLHINVSVEIQNYGPRPDALYWQRVEWAFDERGRIRMAHGEPHPENEPGKGAATLVGIETFDGALPKSIGVEAWSGRQLYGSIFNDELFRDRLIDRPSYRTEFARMAGFSIEGKSLLDWLDEGQLAGEANVDSTDCLIYEVKSTESVKKFYLSKAHGFALKRFEIVAPGGETTFALVADELSEVKPGIWLPMAGGVLPQGRVANSIPLEAYSWKVDSLRLNEPLADELFDLAFEPGLEVHDARFSIQFRWKEGLDPKSQDYSKFLIRERFKKEVEIPR